MTELRRRQIKEEFGWPDYPNGDLGPHAFMNVVDHGWYDRRVFPAGERLPSMCRLFEDPSANTRI